MSGHSHSKKIKHAKELTDKKRGKAFSKMAKTIWIAVREGGPNPETNLKLRSAIDSAHSIDMPKENIERAVQRASGKIPGEKLEEATYEAYGPGGIAIIIKTITDNKNRTLNEIKKILSNYNGKLVSEGGAKWMFENKINPETKNLEWVPKQEIKITDKEKETAQKLFEVLDENDSVQEIYSNIKANT